MQVRGGGGAVGVFWRLVENIVSKVSLKSRNLSNSIPFFSCIPFSFQ